MSNEVKSWLSDAKRWIEKYPFLIVKDNSVYPWIEVNSTEEHWLTDLPRGWVNSFGEKMCDELLAALGKYVNDFIIVQTKEKYGSIRIYWRWRDREYTKEEIEERNQLFYTLNPIITKYEEISYHTCVKCGAQATHYSEPWILPYCEKCFDEQK